MAASRTTPPTVRLRTSHPFALFIPHFDNFTTFDKIKMGLLLKKNEKSKTGLSGSLLLVSAC